MVDLVVVRETLGKDSSHNHLQGNHQRQKIAALCRPFTGLEDLDFKEVRACCAVNGWLSIEAESVGAAYDQ